MNKKKKIILIIMLVLIVALAVFFISRNSKGGKMSRFEKLRADFKDYYPTFEFLNNAYPAEEFDEHVRNYDSMIQQLSIEKAINENILSIENLTPGSQQGFNDEKNHMDFHNKAFIEDKAELNNTTYEDQLFRDALWISARRGILILAL